MSAKPGDREVRREIYIEAEIVDADPVPGGVFRLAERGGMQIEGRFVEVVPYSKVVYTWGGIVGVAPGQSTVEFLLEQRLSPFRASSVRRFFSSDDAPIVPDC